MESEILSSPKKKKTEETDQVDRISLLPDDIIAAILSRLTMAEAARTSILSVRWRHLWTYFNGYLDFDDSIMMHELNKDWGLGVQLIHEERERYRSWVDGVLKSLQNKTVEGLRICFDVGNASYVDGWVQFAIEKKVKKLELDLIHSNLTKGFENCVIPSLLNYTSFRSLHVLRLSYVDVSGQLLECFLSSCPFLETLSVVFSKSIVSFNVSNSSSLKHLEIRRCFTLKTLEIFAKNLESFTYSGYDISINYKHIPNLRKVSFRGAFLELVFRDFFRLSTYDHSHLEELKLEIMMKEYNFELPKNFVLANLHHLGLHIVVVKESDLHYCVSLMNICPSLRTLTLMVGDTKSTASAKFGTKHPYHCLEEVKLIGFSGSNIEIEFFEYIIENATNLRKVTVDPLPFIYFGGALENKLRKTEDYASARTRARDMEAKSPPWVKFVIM